MIRDRRAEFYPAEWRRPEDGPVFAETDALPLTGRPGWRSNGGPSRGHPARALPLTLEISGRPGVRRVHVVGIFAMYADATSESRGSLGGSLHFGAGSEILMRVDLVNGRNYDDARRLDTSPAIGGDGTSAQVVGSTIVDGVPYRVDNLSIDIPENFKIEWVRLKDLGTAASFVVFDVFFECAADHGCPFHKNGGGVPLADVGPALRLGDRVKFGRALKQLSASLAAADNLDEAKGQALTFAAVVAATALEMGGGREMHRWMLHVSRQVDAVDSAAELAELVRQKVDAVANQVIPSADGPSAYLMDRALAYVDRHYAKELTDAVVADQIGLSTSHFRFLFRQSTGQPFHRYLVNLRLEKAKQLLTDRGTSVGDAAKAVGFSGLAHFSRAFQARFHISPTAAKRQNS